MRIQTVLAVLLMTAIATPALAGDVVMRKGTKSFQTVQRSEGAVDQGQDAINETTVAATTEAGNVADIAPAAGTEEPDSAGSEGRQTPRHTLPRK